MDGAARARLVGAVRVPLRTEWLVLLVALAPRLGFVLDSAGLRGTFGYDPSVYYAASDALLHGRLPYSDYVLLHPPGITLALAPFAWFGELTTDHRGFVAANLAFTLLGAVNAVLVVRVATRLGWGRGAALAGGLCYAAWIGAIGAEYLIRLEPLGNFCLLCGLLAYSRAEASVLRRWPVLCGVGFGAAAAVQIWWVVPLALILGWHLAGRRRGRLLPVLAGAAGALALIDGPFFAVAPRQMWSMVVVDQLGRNPAGHLGARLTGLTGLRQLDEPFTQQHVALVVALALTLLAAVCLAALRTRGARLIVLLLVAQAAVLVAAPSWFPFYDDYVTPALALTVAAAAAAAVSAVVRGRSGRARRAWRWGLTTVAGVVAATLAAGAVVLPARTVRAYPSAHLAEAVEGSRCVMSDSPMALIELDVLSRDLSSGCRDWVDVTGRTYGPDAPPDGANGRPEPRSDNLRWQRDLTAYLLSGDTVTLFRPFNTGIGPKLRAILRRERVLARVGDFTVFETHRLAHVDPDA